MKKSIISFLIIGFTMIGFLSSCKKDTASNQKFIGTYNGTLYLIERGAFLLQDTTQGAETLIISAGANAETVNLKLVNEGLNGTATISGNALTIVPTSDGTANYNGAGSINGSAITAYVNKKFIGSSVPEYNYQYLFKGNK